MKAKVNKVALHIVTEPLLEVSADVLVTVTDPNLSLSPLIEKRISSEIQTLLAHIGWMPIGDAVITPSGGLKTVRHIIHGVAPRYTDDNVRAKLGMLVWRCLEICEEHGLNSIVFPPLSTGTLGFPLESCAYIMFDQIIDFTFEKPKSLKKIIISADSPPTAREIFEAELMRQLEDLRQSGEGQVSV